MNIPFKVGFCACCGKQSMVRDTRGNPINGIVGTRVVWLCLCDAENNIKTRVGTLTLCGDCDPNEVNCAVLKQNLADSMFSGVTGNEEEFTKFPNMKIEVVKRFGD